MTSASFGFLTALCSCDSYGLFLAAVQCGVHAMRYSFAMLLVYCDFREQTCTTGSSAVWSDRCPSRKTRMSIGEWCVKHFAPNSCAVCMDLIFVPRSNKLTPRNMLL